MTIILPEHKKDKYRKDTKAQKARSVDSKSNIQNSTLLFHASDLTWDQFIYPRESKSEKTINAYVEALEIRAQFPPIKIQRVFNYPSSPETTKATIILDGIHRWFAFKEKGIKEIAAVEWKSKPLDYEKNKTTLLLESAECNISHGDRLSPGDKKRIARDIASTDPECKWTESALAEKLGVIQQTVNTWISDIRARQKASRNTVIFRLSRLGWSQEKIAEVVGLSQNRVSEIIGNTSFSEIDNLLAQGRDMEYIARHYNMDFPLVWALRLEGKTDQEKFKELNWGLRTWDQWNFNECLPREIHVNDSEAYFTGVMNDSETTGQGGYRLSSLRIHCSISQNPGISSSTQWLAERLSLMCAFSLGENVNLLILQRGIIDRKSNITIGTPVMGFGL